MKKLLFVVSVAVLSMSALSQDEAPEYKTIFDGKDIRISGMGGPMMMFTSAGGDFAHFMGGGGGVMINDFFFGGYGQGLTNSIIDKLQENHISMGHGGFWLGYSLLGHLPVHLTASTMVGFGEIGLRPIPEGNLEPEFFPLVSDQIFALIPSVELELNITRYFRLCAGANYSLITGVNNIPGYSNADFSSFGASLGFKFGWF